MTGSGMASGTPWADGRTVLLVDDDRDVLAALRRTFLRAGWTVAATGSPEVALDRLSGGGPTFDLLVTDIFLGAQTSGFQLARRARELQPEAGILLISTLLGAEWPRTSLSGSRVEFLKKPFDVDEMLAAAERLSAEGGGRRDSDTGREGGGGHG